MAGSTKRFFESLGQREGPPALRRLSGTIRCDLQDGKRTQHWFITVGKGDISVSHSTGKADCTLSTDLATFEAILAGEMNAMAAVLRGVCAVEGKVGLLVALQAFFRPSPGAPTRQVAGYARRPT